MVQLYVLGCSHTDFNAGNDSTDPGHFDRLVSDE